MIQVLTYKEVQTVYPSAWKGLPSSYQGDSCLSFFRDVNGNLCATYGLGAFSDMSSEKAGEYVWCPTIGWVQGN